MKKQIISILFAIVLLFAFGNVCQAANASISCDSSATVGKEITITANVTGVMWNLELKVNGETIAKNSELENVESNKTVSFSGKYTPKAEGTLNVTLTGTVTEFSDGSTIRQFSPKTITVKAPVVQPPVNTEPTTTEKSKEARLKTFGITPDEYDFSGFSKNRDKENWSVEVPNNVTSVKVYGTPYHSKATVKGTGNVTLKEGANTVKVTVTAEAGNTKTYTLTITRKTAEETPAENDGTDARLRNLGIKPDKYDFSGFKKDIMTYSHEVPNNVEEIEVYAEAVDNKAKITGTGKTTLKEGINTIVVQVTSANGKVTETYTLEITRKVKEEITEEEPNEPDVSDETTTTDLLGLATLQIEGVALSPKFDAETYEYSIELNKDISSLEIVAKSNKQDATVEVIGNENLKQGENTITILVTDPETEEVVTYQIVVNKKLADIAIVGKVDWLKPSTWGTREIILVSAAAFLLIVIIVAIIIKIIISKSNKVKFPGAEELDRALAEHQELTEEGQDLSCVDEKLDLRQEENDNYDDAIQYGRARRRGKHF